jgi:hypothetical protein
MKLVDAGSPVFLFKERLGAGLRAELERAVRGVPIPASPTSKTVNF